MALSDDELRTLEQLEAALATEDPKLASTLRGRPHYVVQRRKATLSVLALAGGLALLILGVSTFFLLSVIGFAAMFVGAIGLFAAVQRVPSQDADQPRAPRTHLGNQDFVAMMERQWRRQHPDDPS